jgi:hypothetical protein
VLVYSAEDSLDDWRLKAAAIHRGGGVSVEDALERIYIVDKTEGLARFSEVLSVRSEAAGGQVTRRRAEPTEEREQLIATAKKIGAVLVLVETASRLVEEEDNAEFSGLQSALGHVGRATGAAVIVSHHVTKAASKDNDAALEAARGGGAFVSNARNALSIFPAEELGKGFRDRFAAADLFALVHRKATSSTRCMPPLVLARCDATFGAVFRRPGDAPASPEQAAAAQARRDQEQEAELQAMGRLYDLVERSLPSKPSISPAWLRDRNEELGLGKHRAEDLVNAAVERGILKVRSRDKRGITVVLGRDPRLPINASTPGRAGLGESPEGAP